MFSLLNKLICKIRGYHDWIITEYHDESNEIYFVTKCKCCGLVKNYPLKSEWHNYFPYNPESESEPDDEEKERILKERLLNGIKNNSYM